MIDLYSAKKLEKALKHNVKMFFEHQFLKVVHIREVYTHEKIKDLSSIKI